jgi:phage recombination protein Bet
MSTQLQVINYDEPTLPTALGQSQYPGAPIEQIMMVINYCRAQGLDPLQKPVHLVGMWDSKLGGMRTVVMPGISLYRIQASRSGEYGGVDAPIFGQDMIGTFGTAKDFQFPSSCQVTVHRIVNGQKVSFTAVERWTENYASKKNSDPTPNAMWTKRPYAQLAKCAEAQALRKAFPELCGNYTAEEMEGKSIHGDEKAIDSTSAPCISDEQLKRLKNAMNFAGVDEAYLCGKANIDRLEVLHPDRFEGCMTHLKNVAMKAQAPQEAAA